MKRHLAVGILGTVAIIAVMLWVIFYYYPSDRDLLPNEYGDTFAGFMAAIAMLWLVISVSQQADELKSTREELKLQREALDAQAREFSIQNGIMSRQSDALSRDLELNSANAFFSTFNVVQDINRRRIELILKTFERFGIKFKVSSNDSILSLAEALSYHRVRKFLKSDDAGYARARLEAICNSIDRTFVLAKNTIGVYVDVIYFGSLDVHIYCVSKEFIFEEEMNSNIEALYKRSVAYREFSEVE